MALDLTLAGALWLGGWTGPVRCARWAVWLGLPWAGVCAAVAVVQGFPQPLPPPHRFPTNHLACPPALQASTPRT